MCKFMKKSAVLTMSLTTGIFTFIPESLFGKWKLISNASCEINVILNRLLSLGMVFGSVVLVYALCLKYRNSVFINGKNYSIQICYGDIFKMDTCKKVINFDECFTTTVGNAPSDVKPNSVCGQYLTKNPINNMQQLIDNANLKPRKSRSKHLNRTRYHSGKIIPHGEYLFMAFAKLDEDGLGRLSREEFLDCLSILWKEIDKYYGQKDVCIPILGSGITRMGDSMLTQQELLEIIIKSYQLSTYKIKNPYSLHIVCKKQEGFSLNRIGENI